VKNSNNLSLYKVKLKVSEALTYPTTIEVDATGTEDWNKSAGVSFSGTTSQDTSLSITGSIINKVMKYDNNFYIYWKYKVSNGTGSWIDVNVTSHTLYVTWGTPAGSVATLKRIDFVCSSANNCDELGDAADSMYDALKPEIYNVYASHAGPTPIWLIHDGEESKCYGLALYIDVHFQMLGLGSGETRFCWAHADGTCTYNTQGNTHDQRRYFPITGHSDPTSHDEYYSYERLFMLDSTGWIHNYEAACYFNSTYYALIGSQDGKFANPYDVVTTCFSTDWRYWSGLLWYKCPEVTWP